MNKKQLIVAWVIGIFLLSGCRNSIEAEHPINKSLRACMDKSKCITVEMVKCGEEAYNKWDAELNKYYNLLMGALDKDEEAKIQLKQSQLAWLKFRDVEFEFIPGYFQDPGSYQGPAIIEYKIDIVKERALEFQKYYDTIIAGRTE